MTMSTICPWQPRALLAEVLDGPEIEASRAAGSGDRADRVKRPGTRADHGDDVLAADGARQSAEAGRRPALQAACGSVLGGIRPGSLAGPAASDERHSSGGSCRHGQGPDQPG